MAWAKHPEGGRGARLVADGNADDFHRIDESMLRRTHPGSSQNLVIQTKLQAMPADGFTGMDAVFPFAEKNGP